MSVEKEYDKPTVVINDKPYEVDEAIVTLIHNISLERDHYRDLALDAGLVPETEMQKSTNLSFSQFKKGLWFLISQLFYVITATSLTVIYCVKTGQLELFESFLKNANGLLYIIIMFGVAFFTSILETAFKLSFTILSLLIRIIILRFKNK